LKENKGSFGDLNLGISAATPSSATMNLFPTAVKSVLNSGVPPRNPSSINFFPQQAGFAPVPVKQEAPDMADLSVIKQKPESASPMTIFYGGQVIVFDDFPAEKAKEIMLLASKGSQQIPSTFNSTTLGVQKPSEPSKLAVASTPKNIVQERVQTQRTYQTDGSDLPIARKASLTRFLEKRKDRMTARTPYQVGSSSSGADASPSKAVDSKSWLGLAPQSPLPFEAQM